MIPILFESTERDFNTNGLGRLRDCLRCEVTEERNGIYEVEFDYPINGQNIDNIIPGRIILVEHDETGDTQPFDIYSYSKPINGVITFRARHVSYRLNEMTVSGTGISSLSAAFTAFAGSSPACPFSFTSNLTASNYIAAFDGTPRTIRQILGGVEGSILDSYGGEYVWDGFTVRLLSARGSQKDYTIRYGENLIDFNEDLDYSGTYSAVIPYWMGQDGAGVVKGSMVSSGYAGIGGRTVCVPLDLTDKFENQPTAAQLETAAASYLESNTPYNPGRNITINFVKVQDSNTERILSELQKFGLCDSIRVILPKYGINAWYKIVKVVWDVLLERYIEMELGNLSTSLSEALGISDSGNAVSSIKKLPTHASGSVTVNSATSYNICSVTLPAGGRYLVMSNVYTDSGVTMTILNNLSVTGGDSTVGHSAARTTTSSGQGVVNWMYVDCETTAATVTLMCYGYYTTSHKESGVLLVIPL